MADETKPTENADETASGQQPTEKEPQGTDWKAMARKHEDREKEWKQLYEATKKELTDLQKANEAKAKDAKAKGDGDEADGGADELQAALARVKELEGSIERDRMVREVAKRKGVDPDLLLPLKFDSKEDVAAYADKLVAYKRSWSEVSDGGAAKAPQMTKEQILAEKDPKKQLRLIAENRDLF